MKKLSKRSIRLLQSIPRGCSIPCGFRLLKPKKGRLTAFCCARGAVYDITGELSTVRAPLCPRHRDFYLAQGLTVETVVYMFQTLPGLNYAPKMGQAAGVQLCL
jgi:hypothetical protein